MLIDYYFLFKIILLAKNSIKTPNKAISNINTTGFPDIDYIKEIKTLKKKKNAILLTHYYQIDEVQEIADFVGDTLDLA